jgi:hypothetical protein
MSKVSNWFESKLFWLKTGSKLEIANDGKPVEEVVIRYKDYFFMVDIDAESGEPTGGFGWNKGNPITPVPVREFYTAVREEHS